LQEMRALDREVLAVVLLIPGLELGAGG